MKLLSTAAFVLAAGLSQASLAADFELRSNNLKLGQAIHAEHYWNNFGCSGDNVMPELHWKNVPAGTQSFAVTFYDETAPTGSGFWHWVVYDIPVTTTSLAGGVNGTALPTGAVEGNTDLGKPGFFGPCPPIGRKHNYVYTLHALKVAKLPVDAAASPALIGFMLWQNRIEKATLRVTAGPRK